MSVEMGHMNVSCGGRSRPTMRCSRRAKTHAAERSRYASLVVRNMAMRNVRALASLLVTTGLITVSQIPAYSCSCEEITPTTGLRKANAVFVGQVVQISPADEKLVRKETGLRADHTVEGLFSAVTFKVERYWKGVKGREITILSDQGVGIFSCKGYAFREGERYLVYARGRNMAVYTGCSISEPIERATEALKELGQVKRRISSAENRRLTMVNRSAANEFLVVSSVLSTALADASVMWRRP
jgi:hypothetical protein